MRIKVSILLAVAFVVLTIIPGCTVIDGRAKQPASITMWSFTSGSAAYMLAFNMAHLVNSNSDWLEVVAQEGAGSNRYIQDLIAKPELRKSVFFHAPESTVAAARNGVESFPTPYAGARVVVAEYDSNQILVTYRDDIRSKDDLKGKRVMLLPKTVSTGLAYDVLFKKVWNLEGQVNISIGQFPAAARALRDGAVDAAVLSANGLADVWDLSPDAAGLAVEKPGFRAINVPAEDVRAVNKASGWLFHPITHPAGSFPGSGMKTPEAVTGVANMVAYWADESVPDDVVYEFVRILYERMDELKQRYAGSYLTRKNMASVPVPEDWFHPGALKFYKERGVPVGLN